MPESKKDIVQLILDLKEWQIFECKRALAVPSKTLETIVAFANAEGGTLVLGLEDAEKATGKNRLFGISEGSDKISEIINLIPKEITPPLPRIRNLKIPIVNINGNSDELLVFIVDRRTDVHSLKRGDTYIRRGRHNYKMTAQEIIRLKYAKGSIRYESEPALIRKERFARNPIILRTLNRFGDEAPNLDIGEGVDRMFRIMKTANLYDPIYFPPHITPNSVLLILFNIERISYWDTVSKYLDKKFKITNKELRRITGISHTLKASRLLKTWTKQGLLEEGKGVSKKMKYYHKPGVKLEESLFS